jgi:hypothetical protein
MRPSTTYTKGVKKKLLREQGLDESLMGEFQLDHIIPLSVGGHPRQLSNLMLQPIAASASCAACLLFSWMLETGTPPRESSPRSRSWRFFANTPRRAGST